MLLNSFLNTMFSFDFDLLYMYILIILLVSFLNYCSLVALNLSRILPLSERVSSVSNFSTLVVGSDGNYVLSRQQNIFLSEGFYDSYSAYENSAWRNSHPHQIVYYEFVPLSPVSAWQIVNLVVEVESNTGIYSIFMLPNILYALWLHATSIWCPYSYLWFATANLISCFVFFLTNEEELMAFDSSSDYSIFGVSLILPVNGPLLFSFYIFFILFLNLFLRSLFRTVTEVHFEIQMLYIRTTWSDIQWRYGINLFIISEVMVFFAFFWVFFHNSLSPSIEIADSWPPSGIQPLKWYHLPLLNTVILVVSGITVGWFNAVSNQFLYVNMREKGLQNNPIQMLTFGAYVISDFVFVSENIEFFETSLNNKNSVQMFILTGLVYKKSLYLYTRFMFGSLFLCFKAWAVNFVVLFYNISRYDNRVPFYLSFDLFNFNRNVYVDLHWSLFRGAALSIWANAVAYSSLNLTLIFSYLRIFSDLLNFYSTLLFFCLDSEFLLNSHVRLALSDLYISMFLTLYLGYYFLGLQFCEYNYFALFNMKNVFGTVFYFLTCLHGLHVFIGLLMLGLCYTSLDKLSTSSADRWFYDIHNSLLYFSVRYWHFVDVVWVILYVTLYMWGSWTGWFSLNILPPWL